MKKLIFGIFGLVFGLLTTIVVCLALTFGVLWLVVPAPDAVAPTVADDPDLPALTIGDYSFHSESFGPEDAPVVVVLHGGAGNDYLPLLPLKALTPEYRVVFYDQRGAGLSPRVPDEELSFEQYIEDLSAIVDQVSPDAPVRIIAHSFGAMLATAFLEEHAHRVSHVVLVEPGFLTPELGTAFTTEFQSRASEMGVDALWAIAKLGAQSLKLPEPHDDHAQLDFFWFALATSDLKGNPLAGYFCNEDTKTAKLESWRMGARANLTINASAIDDEGRVTLDLRPGAAAFPREALILAGSCNVIIGEATQRKHAALFPKARVVVIEDAGHTLIGEQPVDTLAAIRPYFATKPAPAL